MNVYSQLLFDVIIMFSGPVVFVALLMAAYRIIRKVVGGVR